MGSAVVFIEQSKGELLKASLAALSAARKLKASWNLTELCAVVLGDGASKASEKLKSYGFQKVYFSENEQFRDYLAVPYAEAVFAAMNECSADLLVAAATSNGKDFSPRVTAKIDAAQASDIVAVSDQGNLTRPMYAGDVLAEVKLNSTKRVVTVRPTAFSAAEPEGDAGSCEVKELTAPQTAAHAGKYLKFEGSGGDRPDLAEAEVVVSGGRALQSEENFEKIIFPLADALKAAVGASRAAVDAGYAPNDWQVGQTGKVVAPQLYIAIGISGAIQHLAGMKSSKCIVAINKDPDAPIFEIADYGLVADLYDAVPKLTEEIKKAG